MRAQLALIAAQIAVWTRPQGQLVTPATTTPPTPDEGAMRASVRLARAVYLASRRGLFRPNCLVRSVALGRLLEREGVSGWRMRIGVRDRGGRFEAHAWIEIGTYVLGDSSDHVGSFERLTDVRLIEAR
jgi:hypothetical protein